MYINERIKDVEDIQNGITVDNIVLYDKLRIFSGDGPARQFECGQQRGGHYSCICGVETRNHTNFLCTWKILPMSLDDHQNLLQQGILWKKSLSGDLYPFRNLKKKELEEELEARSVEITDETKPKLVEHLNDILHGICRPPALMLKSPTKSSKELYIDDYEILGCEPLHDITNIIQHLIEELPYHIENLEARRDLEKFASNTIGEKNQIKRSDARLYAVKLAMFITTKHDEGKISESILELINALIDIISIAYSPESKRYPRQILRLFNACFKFGVIAKTVFGSPKKMTTRKCFGSHFHSIVSHLPVIYKIFNTKTILTEQEERGFGDIRSISERTTNRKPGQIIENCIIRFNAKQDNDDRSDSFQKQDSSISSQSKLLPDRPRTLFSKSLLSNNAQLVQGHLSRIADFLLPGEGIWWHIDVIFHDSQADPLTHLEGPILSHFRSSSVKEESKLIEMAWQECINKAKSSTIILPLSQIKTFSQDGKVTWLDLRKEIGTFMI